MKRKDEIKDLLKEIKAIIKRLNEFEERYKKPLSKVHPANYQSAVNLIHYIALRSEDIRPVQMRLGNLGLSRLGRAERHVMANVYAIQHTLKSLLGKKSSVHKPDISIKKGRKLLRKNTRMLLGQKRKGSSTRIMVTLPAIAADDRWLIPGLMKAGMGIARINCAHDDPEVWEKMIDRLKKARKNSGKSCKVAMDLGGPKMRTGSLEPGPRVIRLKPKRDLKGRIVAEPLAWLAVKDNPKDAPTSYVHLPVDEAWVDKIRNRNQIEFYDTRNKHCTLTVVRKEVNGAWAYCNKSAYVETGTSLVLKKRVHSYTTQIGQLPRVLQAIVVKEGDTLEITRDPAPGGPAEFNEVGNLVHPARISCQVPEVFEELKPGEPILLDDGKLSGTIMEVRPEKITVHVDYAIGGAVKLRADKGMNFPQSNLSISGLSRKDREDLEFVTRHADIVNLSFVNSPSDVRDLCQALDEQKADDLGIILKIETLKGYKNLPEILLAGMRRYPLGVMIARGDLAIETGWQNLARIQEEILWMCESAHVPIVWATQVLETLAKKGQPSRAEISDVAIAERAECVMLNKGPHIVQTVQVLDKILTSMEDYQDKKAPLLPIWHLADDVSVEEKIEPEVRKAKKNK